MNFSMFLLGFIIVLSVKSSQNAEQENQKRILGRILNEPKSLTSI
jgi:hypothetical protein